MIDQIPADVVMYLINAIYLKATWQYQFDKEQTEKQDFMLRDGGTVQADMMYSDGVKANYYANDQLQFVEIPYGNGQFVFSILLPYQPEQLNQIIQTLDMQTFNTYLEASDTATFKVYLPKFKIEYKTLLNEVLASMGMALSFSGGADFSDLFVEELDLFISRVLHQSFLEVDEEGTEAAAATVVEIMETSVGPGAKPEVIRVDKPFAFFIREKHSHTILFSGKLMDPTR
jgi:serpin B